MDYGDVDGDGVQDDELHRLIGSVVIGFGSAVIGSVVDGAVDDFVIRRPDHGLDFHDATNECHRQPIVVAYTHIANINFHEDRVNAANCEENVSNFYGTETFNTTNTQMTSYLPGKCDCIKW